MTVSSDMDEKLIHPREARSSGLGGGSTAPARPRSFRRRASSRGAGLAGLDAGAEYDFLHIWWLASFASLVTIYFGYDVGMTAWVVVDIDEAGDEGVSSLYEFLAAEDLLRGFIVASMPLGAALGCLASHEVSNKMGRLAEMKMVCRLTAVGACIQALTGLHDWDNVTYLLCYVLGRIVYGFGVGISLQVVPTYMAEMSPSSIRGKTATVIEIFVVLGMVIAYLIGGFLDNALSGFWGAVFLAVVNLAGLSPLPETPYYMLLHPRRYKARDVLKALRYVDPHATEADVAQLQSELAEEAVEDSSSHHPPELVPSNGDDGKGSPALAAPSSAAAAGDGGGGGGTVPGTPPPAERAAAAEGSRLVGPGRFFEEEGKGDGDASSPPRLVGGCCDGGLIMPWSDYYVDMEPEKDGAPSLLQDSDPAVRQSLKVVVGIMLLQQGCGMNAVLYYCGVILRDIGWMGVSLGLSLVGCAKLLSLVVVMRTVEVHGRKKLLTYGNYGLLLGTSLLAFGGYLDFTGDSVVAKVAALVGFYSLVLAYALSIGPVAWVVLGEMFPARWRAQASSICILVNVCMIAILTMMLPGLQCLLGYGGLFTLFALVCLWGVFFIRNYVVETKQLTLTQIQRAVKVAAGHPPTPVPSPVRLRKPPPAAAAATTGTNGRR